MSNEEYDDVAADNHSPNLTFLRNTNFNTKFLPTEKIVHKSYTSSISSLVEDSSSSIKEKKNDSKKSQTYSSNRENLLVEAIKNRSVKSNRTDQEMHNISKIFVEKKDEIMEDHPSKRTPSLVNINRIILKSKQILRKVRKTLQMREYQKTKTRNFHFVNDFTMEITDKKNEKINNVFFLRMANLQKTMGMKIVNFCSKSLNKFFIIWLMFYMSFVVVINFLLTVDIFFKANTPLEIFPFMTLALCLLILNVLFNVFRLKIPKKVHEKKLLLDFFRSIYFLDFTCFIVIILTICNVLTTKDFWLLIYLFQLHNYMPLHNFIIRTLFSQKQLQQYFILLSLIVRTWALAHSLACISYYLALENPIPDYFTWDSQYLTALHDSLSTLFLINSQNLQIFKKSIGFSCVAIFISGFWYLYILKTFIGSFNEQKEKTFETFEEEHFKGLIRCMNSMKIKKGLILNVKDYLENIEKENKNVLISLTGNEAFNKLSLNLKNDFLAATQIKVFGNLPMLNKNFSEAFLRKLLPKMMVTHYNPENIIYNKADPGEEFLFILAFGQVELYVNLGKKQNIQHTFKKVPKGDVFGEFSFFVDSPKSHFAKAVTPVSIYKISRQDFLDLLKNFPEDYENYCFIKDSLKLYGDFKVLQVLCNCCQATDHDIEHCPVLTLQLNAQEVIKRHQFSRSQDRFSIKRKPKKRMNSLCNYRQIESQALKIEIPANFSSSCDKSENNTEENNTQTNISNNFKAPVSKPKSDPPPNKDGSLKCYETLDDIGAPIRSNSKKGSLIGDVKLQNDKKDESWKSSVLDFDPLNQKFCSLEILMEEKSRRKYNNEKGSEPELNPNLMKGQEKEKEEEKEDTGGNGTVFTGDSRVSKIVNQNSKQEVKKSVFNKSASNDDIKKRNSASYGSFSINSLQNLNFFKEDHFFQTDEILGGTNKNTTTVATIQEFLLKNFESMSNFKVYFPHNNFENVIKWCRILQKGKRK